MVMYECTETRIEQLRLQLFTITINVYTCLDVKGSSLDMNGDKIFSVECILSFQWVVRVNIAFKRSI